MSKPHLKTKILDKIIYILIFALFICPLLIPYSYFPCPKYVTEILVLGLSCMLALVAIYRVEQISISSVGIGSICFAIFLLLQIFVLGIRFPGINLAIAIEFFVIAALSISITSLVKGDVAQQQKIVKIIMWAVLISTSIQAFYGLLQYTGIAEDYKSFIMFVGTDGTEVFGNIGQKNDYVDFIGLGLFALIYLYFIGQFNLFFFTIHALFFCSILTFTTSRIPLVFFIFALAITLIFIWNNKKKNEIKLMNKKLLLIILGLLIGLLLLGFMLPKIVALISHREVITGIQRFSSNYVGQTTYRRFYEWWKDLVIFVHNPIFGTGLYQYPKDAIYLMLTERFMYIPQNWALYTHSHNSPLNLLAETGAVGFLITMIYGFGYSLYRMFKNFNNYSTLFLSFLILTIFAQGLFQYPLWYAYFLVYFILFLSIDKPIYFINNNKTFKGIATLLSLGFFILCISSTMTYYQITNLTERPKNIDDYKANVQQLEKVINTDLIWSFPALLVLDSYNLPGTPETNASLSMQAQQKYSDMLGNELPYPSIIFKQMILHKINGDNQGSIFYADLLAHAYPFFKDKFVAHIQDVPQFAEEVKVINDFHYQDKSIFAKILNKKDENHD